MSKDAFTLIIIILIFCGVVVFFVVAPLVIWQKRRRAMIQCPVSRNADQNNSSFIGPHQQQRAGTLQHIEIVVRDINDSWSGKTITGAISANILNQRNNEAGFRESQRTSISAPERAHISTAT